MGEALEKFHPLDRRPIKIFFQDEGRFGRMTDVYKCWCPKGIRPLLKKALEREFTYVYSAVEPLTGDNFSLILPEVNNISMSLYLKELSSFYFGYRIVIVMDSASFHSDLNAVDIDNISIVHLPAYSPELNPVEHLWDYLRENYFGNRYWKTIEELEIYLENILRDVHKDKLTLKSLTGFDWINQEI